MTRPLPWTSRGFGAASAVSSARRSPCAAVSEPERYALALVPQVEGAAALRYSHARTGHRRPHAVGDRGGVEQSHRGCRPPTSGSPSLVEGKQGDYHSASSGPGEALQSCSVWLALAFTWLCIAPTLATRRRTTSARMATRGAAGAPLALKRWAIRVTPNTCSSAASTRRSRLRTTAPRVFLGGVEARPEGSVALHARSGIQRDGTSPGLRLAYRGDRIGTLSMMADVDGVHWAAYFAELGEAQRRGSGRGGARTARAGTRRAASGLFGGGAVEARRAWWRPVFQDLRRSCGVTRGAEEPVASC